MAALVCAAVLVGCSSGHGGAASSQRSTTTRAETPRASDDKAETTTSESKPFSTTTASPAKPVSSSEAHDLLTVLAPIVPIPEDARECVADKLTKDPGLAAALRSEGAKGSVPDGVMDLGAACMDELHALPAFIDGLDQQVDGGLSAAERACVEKGYRALDPKVLDAAVADAVGAGKGTKPAAEIKSMLRECGVKVGG